MPMLVCMEAVLMLACCAHADPCAPTPAELDMARRWTAAVFAAGAEGLPTEPHLLVLANNDPVQQNARGGRPLNIAGARFRNGLYCHAQSEVVVRLGGPATAFRAVVGVDSNEQTSGGRGSVVFAVRAGGEDLYRSPVMREGMAGLPVEVALNGLSEFTLEVGDAGDGISCDQADWAEASVEMADGRVLGLGNLPVVTPGQTEPEAPGPIFSFRYGGAHSSALLPTWEVSRETEELDSARVRHTATYSDPQTGLEVRCVAVEYRDFPTVEWTLVFRNAGESDTPVLSEIQALDLALDQPYPARYVLHHHVGTLVRANDYEPLTTELEPNASVRFAPPGGRPCGVVFPYYNLEWLSGGLILAVGWPGQWAASFERDAGSGLRVRAGQELTHLVLRPGEEIRTPLIAVQWWRGDWVRAQNVWRRWMLAHNLPRPRGELPPPQMNACSSHQFAEMIHANEENQIHFVDRYLEERLPLGYWWMDAGWYVNEWGWPNTGTWEVDSARFPNGLRAITDHAHARGVRSIVWFEPERVTPGTWLYEEHPEWLLGRDGEQKLLDLGNAEARDWLVEHVDGLIREQGIDLYRQDYNIDPLRYWREADAPDRQGVTENRYVSGYLAYWDELLRRHPDMLIDTCASGGHRNDLETLRRSVPLLRSDYIFEPVGQQCHTYGLAFWMPFWGTGVISTDAYDFRSIMSPSITACWDVRRADLPYDRLRRLLAEWQEVAPHYFGDYYPLSPYSTDRGAWMAWQFDRPKSGDGIVQVFRRDESIYEAARLRLRGLDPDADYDVYDLSAHVAVGRFRGRELTDRGMPVRVDEQPGAVVLVYRRMGDDGDGVSDR